MLFIASLGSLCTSLGLGVGVGVEFSWPLSFLIFSEPQWRAGHMAAEEREKIKGGPRGAGRGAQGAAHKRKQRERDEKNLRESHIKSENDIRIMSTSIIRLASVRPRVVYPLGDKIGSQRSND